MREQCLAQLRKALARALFASVAYPLPGLAARALRPSGRTLSRLAGRKTGRCSADPALPRQPGDALKYVRLSRMIRRAFPFGVHPARALRASGCRPVWNGREADRELSVTSPGVARRRASDRTEHESSYNSRMHSHRAEGALPLSTPTRRTSDWRSSTPPCLHRVGNSRFASVDRRSRSIWSALRRRAMVSTSARRSMHCGSNTRN